VVEFDLAVPHVEWPQWVNELLNSRNSFLPDISEGPGGYRGSITVLTERGRPVVFASTGHVLQARRIHRSVPRRPGEHGAVQKTFGVAERHVGAAKTIWCGGVVR
jgi:hypothetical protein